MELSNILSFVFAFIMAFLITWIVLSVALIWLQPEFFNEDGSLNWLTTLWVAFIIVVLTFLFLWLIYIIVYLIKQYMINDCCEKVCEPVCPQPVKLCPPVNPCDPCADKIRMPGFTPKMYNY